MRGTGVLALREASFSSKIFLITPVDNYEEIKSEIEQDTNADKFVYLPIINRARIDPANNGPTETTLNARRPAHLFKLPVSRMVRFVNTGKTFEELRQSDAAFLKIWASDLFPWPVRPGQADFGFRYSILAISAAELN